MLPTGNQRCYIQLRWHNHTVHPASTPALSLRGFLAALGALVSGLHLVVAFSRGADWRVEGATLTSIGVLAVVSTVMILLSSATWPVGVLGGVSLISAVGIVFTRLVGYPFGPFADYTPPLTAFDIVTLVVVLITGTLAFVSLTIGVTHLGRPGLRFDTVAPIIVVLVALPGIGVNSWTEEAAYISGMSHSHGVTIIGDSTINGLASAELLTIDQRQQLGEQMILARDMTRQFPTLTDAINAGWIAIGTFVPGSGQMVINPATAQQERIFDPARPSALLFATSDDQAPIVGVQYDLWGPDTPDGFVGQGPLWHLHAGTCVINDDRGSFALVYDQPLTGTACQSVQAQLTDEISWMIRAWVIPGWDNPRGPFAHDHPLLTATN